MAVVVHDERQFVIPAEATAALETALAQNERAQLAILVSRNCDVSTIANPQFVKVVCDRAGCVLYMSRSIVPYNYSDSENPRVIDYRIWLGVTAYRPEFAQHLAKLLPSRLEFFESIEPMRALEYGYIAKAIEWHCTPALDA